MTTPTCQIRNNVNIIPMKTILGFSFNLLNYFYRILPLTHSKLFNLNSSKLSTEKSLNKNRKAFFECTVAHTAPLGTWPFSENIEKAQHQGKSSSTDWLSTMMDWRLKASTPSPNIMHQFPTFVKQHSFPRAHTKGHRSRSQRGTHMTNGANKPVKERVTRDKWANWEITKDIASQERCRLSERSVGAVCWTF